MDELLPPAFFDAFSVGSLELQMNPKKGRYFKSVAGKYLFLEFKLAVRLGKLLQGVPAYVEISQKSY